MPFNNGNPAEYFLHFFHYDPNGVIQTEQWLLNSLIICFLPQRKNLMISCLHRWVVDITSKADKWPEHPDYSAMLFYKAHLLMSDIYLNYQLTPFLEK